MTAAGASAPARRKKRDWFALMAELIGTKPTFELVGRREETYIYVDHNESYLPTDWRLSLRNGLYAVDGALERFYCIDAVINHYMDMRTGKQLHLSWLYPKVSLLIHNPGAFYETAVAPE